MLNISSPSLSSYSCHYALWSQSDPNLHHLQSFVCVVHLLGIHLHAPLISTPTLSPIHMVDIYHLKEKGAQRSQASAKHPDRVPDGLLWRETSVAQRALRHLRIRKCTTWICSFDVVINLTLENFWRDLTRKVHLILEDLPRISVPWNMTSQKEVISYVCLLANFRLIHIGVAFPCFPHWVLLSPRWIVRIHFCFSMPNTVINRRQAVNVC